MGKTDDEWTDAQLEQLPLWARKNVLLRNYYLHEWGMPVRDEAGLYERISLEGFQAGLSWETVLRKRDAFRDAFHGFDPDAVAAMDNSDVERLLSRADIIRNEAKIRATIDGARATVALRDDGGLVDFVWSFQPDHTPQPVRQEDVPTRSPESEALARALKRKGFRFVGPVTAFALMEAIGMIDTHLMGSPRRGSSGIWPKSGSDAH